MKFFWTITVCLVIVQVSFAEKTSEDGFVRIIEVGHDDPVIQQRLVEGNRAGIFGDYDVTWRRLLANTRAPGGDYDWRGRVNLAGNQPGYHDYDGTRRGRVNLAGCQPGYHDYDGTWRGRTSCDRSQPGRN